MEKFNQFTFGRQMNVQSDHKPLESICKKALSDTPRRLQNMFMRLQRYDVAKRYHQGKKMFFPDALSRAFVLALACDDSTEYCVHSCTDYIPIPGAVLNEIKLATANDEELQRLKSVVLGGWPDERKVVHPLISYYFCHRDEIFMQDGLILRGDRVIVPHALRSQMNDRIHSSHMGVGSCLRRARECLFWPNMNAELTEYIAACSTCRNYETASPKETLRPHEGASRTWQKIGTDLMTRRGQDFLVTIYYYSGFWELDRLQDTSSKAVDPPTQSAFCTIRMPRTGGQ